MWYRNENGSDIKPSVIDKTTSKKFVYVRKDFVLIEATEDIPAHWQWMETKIPVDDWEIYEKTIDHDTALDDVYSALTELAEMIVG